MSRSILPNMTLDVHVYALSSIVDDADSFEALTFFDCARFLLCLTQHESSRKISLFRIGHKIITWTLSIFAMTDWHAMSNQDDTGSHSIGSIGSIVADDESVGSVGSFVELQD